MARVDHREPAGEQHRKCRLRSLQLESDLVIAVDGHRSEVVVSGLARIESELFRALVQYQIPGALHIACGEWLAVMPFDARAQLEGQFGAVLVPGPARRQIGNDRLQTDLRHVLVEYD